MLTYIAEMCRIYHLFLIETICTLCPQTFDIRSRGFFIHFDFIEHGKRTNRTSQHGFADCTENNWSCMIVRNQVKFIISDLIYSIFNFYLISTQLFIHLIRKINPNSKLTVLS